MNNNNLKNKPPVRGNPTRVLIICAAVVIAVMVGAVIFISLSTGSISDPKPDSSETQTTPKASETALPDNDDKLGYVNPLTGLSCESDLSGKRPVAVMINNIKVSLPQDGISQFDILYECLAEGGITRLLMVKCDYEGLEKIGSVRSSREYYLDLAKNHDAIYVHAGGSDTAYSQIFSRSIDHLDGVNSDRRTGKNVSGVTFWRDEWRKANMAYEHTMVTDGEHIAAGIDAMGYRTTTEEGFKNPMKFVSEGAEYSPVGDSARNVYIVYNDYQQVRYEYNQAESKYYRYQYNQPHTDHSNKEQLSFENLLVLSCVHKGTGDEKSHITITTTGSGSGYFISNGTVAEIKWTKSTVDSPIVYTNADGTPLLLNPGKTAINIVPTDVFASVEFNY